MFGDCVVLDCSDASATESISLNKIVILLDIICYDQHNAVGSAPMNHPHELTFARVNHLHICILCPYVRHGFRNLLGLNDLCSSTKLISTNLILQAK